MAGIVIIGNGVSGITTARHIRKNGGTQSITVISSETKYFYSRTSLMYIYMGHMKLEHTQPYENDFWAKNNIDLVFDHVNEIDFSGKQLKMKSGSGIKYDKLVLAVGSKPNKFGWPGQDLNGVQGLYSYQDLQLMEENTQGIKHAVLVGGGLIGVEMAEMLRTRGVDVTFLVRESHFWGNVLPKQDAELIGDHMTRDHHVDLRLNTELGEILNDGNGKVKGVKTKDGEIIDCQFVGLSAGVSPNVGFLKNTELEIDRGILVTRLLETNMSDVYALGDCAQFKEPSVGRRPLEQVWYTGRMMGEALGKTLAGKPTEYKPGVWFNSAKFFDIEYQTYGEVRSVVPEGKSEFYWQHDSEDVAIHLVFDSLEFKFVGINTFGIRLRHELFDRWLREGQSVMYVLEHMKDANFDPEFYRTYEQEVADAFNKEFNKNVTVKAKSWKRILFGA